MDLKYSSTSIMKNLSKELIFCGQYKINKGQIKPGAPCMTEDNKETLSMHCWRHRDLLDKLTILWTSAITKSDFLWIWVLKWIKFDICDASSSWSGWLKHFSVSLCSGLYLIFYELMLETFLLQSTLPLTLFSGNYSGT